MSKEVKQMTAARLLTLWKKWDYQSRRYPSIFNSAQCKVYADALNAFDEVDAAKHLQRMEITYPSSRQEYEASLDLHSLVEWRCLHRNK